MNWLGRLFGSPPPQTPAQNLMPQYYKIKCVCTNCGWGYPDGEELDLEQGVALAEYLCFQCGCNKLRAARSAPQRRATPKKAPQRSRRARVREPAALRPPDDLVRALRRMGFNKTDAESTATRVTAANPGASAEDLLRKALQEDDGL